jgi:hypothetical protein
MLAMNVVTVKEKTARRGKMHGGEMREGKMREGKMCEGKMRGEKIHGRKRKWNCVSIYGMIGIDVCGGICSKAA